MHTPICDDLGIEYPIFAFTHCRDVVVAVSKAGGFGVLGAVGFTPEQLEIELKWIDENIGDHHYGVDIVIPNKYEGMDATDLSPEVLKKTLNDLVPQEHIDFAKKILADHGVPVEHSDDDALQLLGWTEATATPQVEVALRHPKCTLIANALGTPPADMIRHIHDEGRKVAALCGSPAQARKHADAGVDIIIAQGGEAGGPCGGGGRGGTGAQAARWARSCWGRRASRRSHRSRCWPPEGSVAVSRSPPHSLSARRGRGPVRNGSWSRNRRTPLCSPPPTPRRRAAIPCAAGLSPASRRGCCATTGPR